MSFFLYNWLLVLITAVFSCIEPTSDTIWSIFIGWEYIDWRTDQDKYTLQPDVKVYGS